MFVNDLFKLTENSNEEYYAVSDRRGKPMIMRKPAGKTAEAYAEEKNLTIKGGPFDSHQETESFWIRNVLPTKKEQGVSEGSSIDDRIKGRIQNIVRELSDVPGYWNWQRDTFTPYGVDALASTLKNNKQYIKYALSLTSDDYYADDLKEQGVDENSLNEFLDDRNKDDDDGGDGRGRKSPKARARAQVLKMYGDGDITFRKTSNGGYFIQHEDDFGDTNSHQYDPQTGRVDFSGGTSSSYYGEGVAEGGFDIPEIPRAPQPRPEPKNKTVGEGFDDLDRFMKAKYGPKPSGGGGIKRGTYGQPGRARGRKKGELSGAFHQGGGSDIPHNVGFDRSHSERSAGRRMPRFSDDYDSIKRSEVDEDFDDKSPHSTYVQSIRTLTNKDGKDRLSDRTASLSTDRSGNQRVRAIDGDKITIDTNIPKGVNVKMVPQQGDADIDEGSVQDKLHKRHQELRKKRGAPDPEYYKELKKTYDMPDDERWARTAELKKKYKIKESTITNEDRDRYLEEMQRAGYEIVTEAATLCPECGGAAYADRILAEKQDACYHKVKSRYKVWPSAYASGALVRCRKKGAKNWGNKRK